MAKVTSKLQVTVPKVIAEKYGISPGDEIAWVPAGDAVRVIPASARVSKLDVKSRLQMFDQATERQRRRQRSFRKGKEPADRGWTREDLYDRGRARE